MKKREEREREKGRERNSVREKERMMGVKKREGEIERARGK